MSYFALKRVIPTGILPFMIQESIVLVVIYQIASREIYKANQGPILVKEMELISLPGCSTN
tara:strand:- start:101 stop:283 length:183 start_codon:yes stop_codon:yes gene_type:complete